MQSKATRVRTAIRWFATTAVTASAEKCTKRLKSCIGANPGTGLTLREGMTFTIEPMLNQGTADVRTLRDGWTVVTCDGQLSAQFEHTVAVTRDGVQVLTLRPDEAH